MSRSSPERCTVRPVIGRGRLFVSGLWISLLCICLAGSEAAAAKSGASPRERTVITPIDANAAGGLRQPDCGRKTTVGTGFDVGGFDLGGGGARVSVFTLGGVITAYNSGASAGGVTGFVYCLKGPKRFNRPDLQKSLSPGSTVEVTVRCDRGKTVTHGGFSTRLSSGKSFSTEYEELNVTGSYRIGKRKWRVQAENSSPTESFKIESNVTCVRKYPTLRMRSGSGSVAAGAETSVTARCRPRERAISGGFRVSNGVRVLSSTRKGRRGWRVRAIGERSAGTVAASVHCAKG